MVRLHDCAVGGTPGRSAAVKRPPATLTGGKPTAWSSPPASTSPATKAAALPPTSNASSAPRANAPAAGGAKRRPSPRSSPTTPPPPSNPSSVTIMPRSMPCGVVIAIPDKSVGLVLIVARKIADHSAGSVQPGHTHRDCAIRIGVEVGKPDGLLDLVEQFGR